LRGDPLVYPQQRSGDHPFVVAQAVYVVAQATYLSANAVLFREDAFELAGAPAFVRSSRSATRAT
jgi:hypothetical protein